MDQLKPGQDETATKGIRVLVVDDHPMMREGIIATVSRQSDMEIVGEAADGSEAIRLYRSLRPDVTLMDVQMPGLGGIEALEVIRAEAPNAIVLVLTTYPGDAQAHRALTAGAAGYLLKTCLRKELVDTIRAVNARQRVISSVVAHDIALHSPQEHLTGREISVLRLVAEGSANKEIAWRLSVSVETIKSHLRSIYEKLGVDDRTHAVMIASRRGFLN